MGIQRDHKLKIRSDCKVCFGTGWIPYRAWNEFVKWPCPACIKAEQDEKSG